MKKIFVFYISIFSILSSGCSKEFNPPCDSSVVPVISMNAPLIPGGQLELSVSGVEDIALINWYGPNNFSSHEYEPVIYGLTTVNSGRYTVEVFTNKGCVYTAVTDSLIAGTAPVCNTPNNAAKLDVTFGSISYYSILSTPGTNSYTIDANGDYGDLTLEFYGAAQPKPGAYKIQSLYGEAGTGKVGVRFSFDGQYWAINGGYLYVTVANNKVTASICEGIFIWNYNGKGYKGSLKVTER